MLSLLKRKAAKPKKAAPGVSGPPSPLPSPPGEGASAIGQPVKAANGHAPPPRFPEAFANPQLLRARHVMARLGINKADLRKFIECDLLTPRYLPEPHRLGRRNVPKHQRAFFLTTEVEAIALKLKPRAGI